MKFLSKLIFSFLLLHLTFHTHGQQVPEPGLSYKSKSMIKGLCWSGASVVCIAAACGLAVQGKKEALNVAKGHLGKAAWNAFKNLFKKKRDPNIQQDLRTIFEFLKIAAGPISCLVVAYITAYKAYEEFSHLSEHSKDQDKNITKTVINYEERL